MSPYLISADLGSTDIGRHVRATTTVAELDAQVNVRSISDLFADYAAAVASGDRTRMATIRLAADADLLAELDGFHYPAAA
ncbi:hypothetical protein ACF061_00870 [Streptomyces sp. NPDC015220]|uniref:hypothetical protein n=1 Tax=Streptomyces sp. NPDC015220 TaxID=3364947 RepID=UPI003703555A